MKLRSSVGILVFAVLAAGCGGGLTLSEYADEVEALVHTMNAELDAADVRADSDPTSVSLQQERTRRRAEAREEFAAALAAFDPPRAAEELHDYAVDLTARLAGVERQMADAVGDAGTMDEVRSLWDGPQGDAFRAIDAEAVELCRAAQAYLDATDAAGAFEAIPFIPTEMQEVVVVAFRCTVEERQQ